MNKVLVASPGPPPSRNLPCRCGPRVRGMMSRDSQIQHQGWWSGDEIIVVDTFPSDHQLSNYHLRYITTDKTGNNHKWALDREWDYVVPNIPTGAYIKATSNKNIVSGWSVKFLQQQARMLSSYIWICSISVDICPVTKGQWNPNKK